MRALVRSPGVPVPMDRHKHAEVEP